MCYILKCEISQNYKVYRIYNIIKITIVNWVFRLKQIRKIYRSQSIDD